MSVSVADIIKRMKEQRLGKPLKINKTPTPRIVRTPRVKNSVIPKTSTSCEKYSAKGFGAATMTVPQIVEFIKKKAPQPVFEKFSRLQKKTRPELCKLLFEFEEGYKLLYPENKPRSPEPNLPASNNIEGMLNLAERIQKKQSEKDLRKITNRYRETGFQLSVSPASPVSLTGNSPRTPNYINYNNNTLNNENARMRERNAYLRKLSEKRVVRDPMEGKLSAANLKRLRVEPIKRPNKVIPAPNKREASVTNLSLMKFQNGNIRTPTVATRGLIISKNPRLTKTQLRNLKNQAARTRVTLASLLNSLRSIPVKNRSAVNRMRIRFLARRLADPDFENKFVNKEKYRTTILQRIGLESPPKMGSPSEKSYSMIRGSTANPLKTLIQNARINAILKKNNKSSNLSKKQLTNMKTRIMASMNAARKRQAVYKNIMNFKLEGKHCMSYKKSQLVKVARLVSKGKIRNLDSFTKEELCAIIKKNLITNK